MLSLFSRATPKVTTRFNSAPEFKALNKKIEELESQEKILLDIVNGDLTHIAYQKSQALKHLMDQVRSIINEFNKEKIGNADEQMSSMIVCTTKIKKIIESYLELFRDHFMLQRNSHKEVAKNAIKASGFVAGVAAGAATGSYLLGFVSVNAGEAAADSVIDAVSLNEKRTETVILLEKTVSIITTIQNAIEFKAYELSKVTTVQQNLPLICPITNDRMKNPVFCTLDGRIYEKEAIKKWLTEKRNSPINRKALTEGQSPDDVLIDNISIREAIQELELQFKKASLPEKEEKEHKHEHKKGL